MKWNPVEYWLKSRTYQIKAAEVGRDEPERSFWRSLALEHLLRAALSSVHPALNADPKDEGLHLLYAFGFEIKGEPRSIPIHAVTARLERIVKAFQKPQREFCDYLMMRRNEEVHTCELPFKAMSEAQWLPKYYEACSILNEFLSKTLEEYFGADEATTARKLIAARSSAKRGEIEKRVAAHRAVFEGKKPDEKAALAAAQRAAATGWPHPATRTVCPACKSFALLVGDVEGTSEPVFADGGLLIEQRFLASSLTCGACELELRDVEEIILGGVEPHYTLTVHTDLHDFFQPEDIDSYMNM